MGRSSPFRNLLAHCLPAVRRKTVLPADRAVAATARVLRCDASRQRLTFPALQTIVSYNCLKCNWPDPACMGPMTCASDQTRTAILAAAERLYADRGFGDVTLRDIVAAANVNLAAVNYHFGSKDELIAELFVTRSLATNRERLNELKAAEEDGGGRASIDAILRALVGPDAARLPRPRPRGSTAARFMIRASIESVPPIRRIKNREIDHLRKFAAAMRALAARPQRGRSLLGPALRAGDGAPHHPRKRAADKTVGRKMRPQRRRTAIIERVVAVSVMALTGGEAQSKTPADGARARRAHARLPPRSRSRYRTAPSIPARKRRCAPADLRKVTRIDRVDGREMLRRGAVDVALHDVLQAGARRLQTQLHLLQNQFDLIARSVLREPRLSGDQRVETPRRTPCCRRA